MYKQLVALLLLAALAQAVTVSLGDILPCGPIPTTYDFIGSTFTIQTDVNGTFSISPYLSLTTNLDAGIKSLTLGAAVGYTFSVTPATAVVLQATYTTPAISLVSQSDLAGNFSAGCLQYDVPSKTYNEIDIKSYNVSTKQIVVNFPEASTYVMIGFTSDAYLPAWYGKDHSCRGGIIKKIKFPQGLSMEVYSQNDNIISVNYSTSNPTGITPSGIVYDRYWTFKSNLEQKLNATLTYVYNKTEAAAKSINVSKLAWEAYNKTSYTWQTIEGGYVEPIVGAVYQKTNYLTTWTIAEIMDILPHSYGEVLPTGSVATTYNYVGATFTIRTDVEANFSLSLYTNLDTQFPDPEIQSVTFVANVGLGFTLTIFPASAVVLQATLSTPALSLTSQSELEGGNYTAGVLQYDPIAKTYNHLDIKSYNFTTKQIKIEFPAAGSYALVTYTADVYLPFWYETDIPVQAGKLKRLQFPEDFFVELYSPDQDNILAVNYSRRNPTYVTPSGILYDRFWEFKTNTESKMQATLKYVYNQTEVALKSINVTKLRWEVFNKTSYLWQTVNNSYVDPIEGAIYQTTDYLSTWTVSQVSGVLPRVYGEVLPCGPNAITYDFLGSQFTIRTDVNATFSISLYADITTPFSSSHIKSITMAAAANVGFNLTISPPSAVVLEATLVTPPLSISSQHDIEAGNFSAGALQYNPSSKTYTEIDIDSYNVTTKQIVLEFPESGIYVLVAFGVEAYLPASYGKEHRCDAGETKRFSFPEGLALELYSRDENILSVNYSTSNPTSVSPSGTAYNVFWIIKSSTEEHINATLKYFYNKTEGAVMDANRLRWEFFNETTQKWEAMTSGSYVDLEEGVVIQVTPHFSTWTVTQAPDSATTGESSGNGSTADSMSSAGLSQINSVLVFLLALYCLL